MEGDSGVLVPALIIFILLLFSAFFSGSETGLTAVTRSRIHHLVRGGSRRAAQVQWLKERKEELIGAILLGNNLVNIGASAIATALAIRLFGPDGVAWATLAMTAVVFIFSEVLPKTYALNHPERIALLVAPIFVFLVRVFAPVTRAVQWIVSRTFRLFGMDMTPAISMVSATELLRGTIDLHHHEGRMIKQDRDMIESILDLDEVEVGAIMVHRSRMLTLDADLPWSALVGQITGAPHSRIPLWRGSPDNIIGILHVRDVLQALQAHQYDLYLMPQVESLASEAWFVPETTTLRDQLMAFRARRKHFALVVDEYGDLMGLVTLEDILEEIVGHIEDEHDPGMKGIMQRPDGGYVIHGDVTLRDINRHFDWKLPDEEVSTLAGLVIFHAGSIPETGDRFRLHGLEVEVLRKQRNQLTRLLVRVEQESEIEGGAAI